MPALTVQNAEIKTAAVEVKTLTISGKQVTLAVFRQLKEEPLIGDDGTFNGVPWGTVNYHPDKCADRSEHLHVVWQQGVELRRAYVAAADHRFGPEVRPKTGGLWLDAAAVHGWRPVGNRSGFVSVRFRAGVAVIQVDGVLDDVFWPAGWGNSPDERREREQRSREAALAKVRERVAAVDVAANELELEVEAEITAELARRDRHRARWAEISDLPQLFIAV